MNWEDEIEQSSLTSIFERLKLQDILHPINIDKIKDLLQVSFVIIFRIRAYSVSSELRK